MDSNTFFLHGKGISRSEIISQEISKIKDVAVALDVPHLPSLLKEYLEDRQYRGYHEIEYAVRALATFAKKHNRRARCLSQLMQLNEDHAELEQLANELSKVKLTDTFNGAKRSFGSSENISSNKRLRCETNENIIPNIEAAGIHLARAMKIFIDASLMVDDVRREKCKRILEYQNIFEINNLLKLAKEAGVDKLLDDITFNNGLEQVADLAKTSQNQGIEAHTFEDLAPPAPTPKMRFGWLTKPSRFNRNDTEYY